MFLKKAWAFFQRDMIETLSYKAQVLTEAGSIFAKCLIFFYLSKFIGTQGALPFIPASTDYFGYVLTGIALTGFQSTALQSFAQAVYREQGAGTMEAILISPTSLQTVILSNLFWTALFTVFKVMLYFGFGLLFFGLSLPQINIFSVFLTLILAMTALSGFGMISAGLVLLLKRTDPLGRALTGLSQLLAGVYFPAVLLPAWLQGLSAFLPLSYALKAMRRALFEGASAASLSQELVPLIFLSLILIPCSLIFFRFSLQKFKQDGLFVTAG